MRCRGESRRCVAHGCSRRATTKRSSSAAPSCIARRLPRADRLYLTRGARRRRRRHLFPADSRLGRLATASNRRRTTPTPRTTTRTSSTSSSDASRRAVRIDQWPSDKATLRLGPARRRADGRLPRRGVGRAGARRPQAVRVSDARKCPGRVELARRAAQARSLSPGVRRLRSGEGRPLHREANREAARRPGHHPQSAQDHGGGHQRPPLPRRAGGVRHVRQVHLGIRRRPADPEPARSA